MAYGLITVTPLVDSSIWYSLFQVNSDFFNMDDVYACKSKYWLYDKTWISNVLKNFKSFSVAWGRTRAAPSLRRTSLRSLTVRHILNLVQGIDGWQQRRR